MIRISGIRYINALPLIYGLRHRPDVQFHLDSPSACYQKLIRNEVDVALIPLMGTQINRSIRAVKGLGIAATNRTESVYLFARKPLEHVETVGTDPASLTSVVLLKIIFRSKYHTTPRFESVDIHNIHEALRRYDAILIIGDEAIQNEKTDYDHYDLAREWYSLTRLPFVFAVWASNRPLTEYEKQLLYSSYKTATENWEAIYSEAEARVPVNREFLKRYYNVNLHFQLMKQDYEGILQFLAVASKYRIIDSVRKDLWM